MLAAMPGRLQDARHGLHPFDFMDQPDRRLALDDKIVSAHL